MLSGGRDCETVGRNGDGLTDRPTDRPTDRRTRMASSSENDNGSTSGGGFGQLLKEDLTRLESGLSQHRVDLMGVVGRLVEQVQRVDGSAQRGLAEASKKTGESLGQLGARLDTLERAPKWTKRCSGA